MKNKLKWRCDHCGKWVGDCQLVTFPEEYFPLLTSDNEFNLCTECANKCIINKKYNKEYWLKWIEQKRKAIEDRRKRYV